MAKWKDLSLGEKIVLVQSIVSVAVVLFVIAVAIVFG